HRVKHRQGAAAVTLCTPHQPNACHGITGMPAPLPGPIPLLSHHHTPSGHRVEHRQGAAAVALCSLSTPLQRGG
ncbi:unnamed protein product, partial [Closterium sp. Naga37s-1]